MISWMVLPDTPLVRSGFDIGFPIRRRESRRTWFWRLCREMDATLKLDSTYKLEITEAQRTMLLEGLRFVRSARMLSVRDQLNQSYPNGSNDLRELAKLVEKLKNSIPVES